MTVALLFGGRSTEHIVSINSARTIHKALIDAGFSVICIGITLEGRWYLQEGGVSHQLECSTAVVAVPGSGFYVGDRQLALDAVFATTHGYGGEDGNLQGLCLLCRLPLCGCDTVASALGMHKDFASKLFEEANIPVVPTMVLDTGYLRSYDQGRLFSDAVRNLGPDLFVKPENSGSSVGVKPLPCCTADQLSAAVEQARQYSERVLIQQLIQPLLEVETAVLETKEGLLVAGPGAVIDPAKDTTGFLSYEHKYGQVDTASIRVPCGLDPGTEQAIRTYALKAFQAIKANGYARVDFFFSNGRIYLNEINTAPGMTAVSHYPVLMASMGYDLPTVCTHLVAEALRRFEEENRRIYTPPEL